MDLLSLKFFVFLFFSLVVYHAAPYRWRITAVLFGLNAVFISFYVKNISEAVPFILFVISGYFLVKAVRWSSNRILFGAAIAILVAVFTYLKKYTFWSSASVISQPYLTVGLSYVLFRILQVLIDVHDREIRKGVSPVAFFNYICFFPAFISGPIQRFQDFVLQLENRSQDDVTDQAVLASFSRMVNGYFKTAVLSGYLFDIYLRASERFAQCDSANLVVFFVARAFSYMLYLYLNFSGYMDIVIGIGRLFGFTLPENFNKPFLSGSMLEFWTRWNITLSEWFKFYIFNPMLKGAVYRWGGWRGSIYFGVIAYFFTFLVMGIWHGTTWSFVLFGLLMGGGVAASKLYEVYLGKILGKRAYKNFNVRPWRQFLSRSLTLAYFSLSLACLWLGGGGIQVLIRKVGCGGVLLAAAAMFFMCAGFSLLIIGFEKLREQISGVSAGGILKTLSAHRAGARLWVSAKILALFFFLFLKAFPVPEFVYKVF